MYRVLGRSFISGESVPSTILILSLQYTTRIHPPDTRITKGLDTLVRKVSEQKQIVNRV